MFLPDSYLAQNELTNVWRTLVDWKKRNKRSSANISRSLIGGVVIFSMSTQAVVRKNFNHLEVGCGKFVLRKLTF